MLACGSLLGSSLNVCVKPEKLMPAGDKIGL
jgi:hypothetical protein